MPLARQLRNLIRGTLTLSNTVIKRAGLDRTIDPVSGPGKPIAIPDSVRLLGLKTAMTFAVQTSELFYGVQQDGSALWAPLVCASGSFNLLAHGVDSGPLLLTPIVQAGAAYIVSCPEALLSALNHHIIRIVIEAGAGAWLADSYLQVVTSTVQNHFLYLDCLPTEWNPPRAVVIPGTKELLFSCDSDKLVFALIATDDLLCFDPATPEGSVQDQQVLAASLEGRFAEIETSLYRDMPGTNGLLCLLIHQGVGQNHAIYFGDIGVASMFQAFSASDLETFATIEAGDPLSLWRFARDSSRIRETTNIFSWGVLDEFGLYRSHQYSYYLSDEVRPNFLSVTSDFSGALRREAFAKRDWHPVQNWDGETIAMVTTLHGTRKIPIYIGEPLWSDRAAAFVENLPFPVGDRTLGHTSNWNASCLRRIDRLPNLLAVAMSAVHL